MNAPEPDRLGRDRRASLPAAVLFDLDGTLIDSEPLWFEAERILVGEYGVDWDPEQAGRLVGWSLWDSAAFLREEIGVDLPEQVIIDRMQSHVITGLSNEPPWRPGALALLSEVRAAGVPAGLVTMSHQQLTQIVVSALPTGSFQTVVSGDQVSRGKPAPDPYQLAARRLGVAAGDCVAIEDSMTGARSARDAGCAVLVVPAAASFDGLAGVTVRDSLAGASVTTLSRMLELHRRNRDHAGLAGVGRRG